MKLKSSACWMSGFLKRIEIPRFIKGFVKSIAFSLKQLIWQVGIGYDSNNGASSVCCHSIDWKIHLSRLVSDLSSYWHYTGGTIYYPSIIGTILINKLTEYLAKLMVIAATAISAFLSISSLKIPFSQFDISYFRQINFCPISPSPIEEGTEFVETILAWRCHSTPWSRGRTPRTDCQGPSRGSSGSQQPGMESSCLVM